MEQERKHIKEKIQNYTEIDQDFFEYEEEKEEESEDENIDDIHNIDVLTNIKLDMIQYCDDMALPLCDYLTYDSMCIFIEFLINPPIE